MKYLAWLAPRIAEGRQSCLSLLRAHCNGYAAVGIDTLGAWNDLVLDARSVEDLGCVHDCVRGREQEHDAKHRLDGLPGGPAVRRTGGFGKQHREPLPVACREGCRRGGM